MKRKWGMYCGIGLACGLLAGGMQAAEASSTAAPDTSTAVSVETAAETVPGSSEAEESGAEESETETEESEEEESENDEELSEEATSEPESVDMNKFSVIEYPCSASQTYSIDLDKDGKPETVLVYHDITVNGQLYDVSDEEGEDFPYGCNTFFDVDMGDYHYLVTKDIKGEALCSFFSYEGGKLIEIGEFFGSSVKVVEELDHTSYSIQLTPDGDLYALKKLSVLQTWYGYAHYARTAGKEYKETKAEVYIASEAGANIQVELTADILCYKTMSTRSDSCYLPEGTKGSFTQTDNKEWVFFWGKDGEESGWIQLLNDTNVKTKKGNMDIRIAFDGIAYED